MKKTGEMKGNLMPNRGLREAGDMIASQPVNPTSPSLFELIVRELDKLNRLKHISPAVYSRAIILAKSRIMQLNNIYSRNGRDIKTLILFLLRMARS
jgi:hypothetical protein